MTNDTSLESPCALLLESAKKFANLQKLNFFITKSSYIVKMFAKKNSPKNEKLYIFEKPLTMPFQICKNVCKILNNLIFNQEKLKMCKIFDRLFAKNLQFFFAKLVYSAQQLCTEDNYIVCTCMYTWSL